MPATKRRFGRVIARHVGPFLMGCVVLGYPLAARAANPTVESFGVSAPKEAAYRAAFRAVRDGGEFVVYDASLADGYIKAIHPRIRFDNDALEVSIVGGGSDTSQVTITHTKPGSLVNPGGIFSKGTLGAVRRAIEQGLTTSRTPPQEDSVVVPSRVLLPRPGNDPSIWLTHSEEVTTTGPLDQVIAAATKAVDTLGNEYHITKDALAFHQVGVDAKAGLMVFAREGMLEMRDPAGPRRRMLTAYYNDIAVFEVIDGPEGKTERRRVRVTLTLDYTKEDVWRLASAHGNAMKYCRLLCDAFAGQQSKTISLGQSQAEVEAILGKADQVVDLGTKRILVYKNLKITIAKGVVADVQ